MNAIVTVPPYAPFIKEVAKHPVVSGLRLNTVMPVKEPLEELLKRLQDHGKTVWLDLKARQLRTKGYSVAPFTEVHISHKISVKTPVTAYFGNGREHATVVGVEGSRLLFLEGPQRVIGPGESINIPEPSLVIYGGLTRRDLQYIEAAAKTGIHEYMLSYVENQDDIDGLKKLDDKACIAAKIESIKGMDYVRNSYKNDARLMTARGDLFVEVKRPHNILEAIETIIQNDPEAIAASRILSSLATSLEPECNDITDVGYLISKGYKTFMLGDEVCLRRESVISALNLLEAIFDRYEKKSI
ncbi:hypothetical protein HY486_02580 [Candidatus Woesearchaeota archaeon]|nr:hypothetical protein [Candidatus Woesearchaeota archaeon]